jgi:B12-binding domain/radical SAM domain protein
MAKGLFLIGYDKPNRYSWAILMGFLESQEEIMNNITFQMVKYQLYELIDHEEELNKIDISKYDFIVLGFSLMTIQMPKFKKNIISTIQLLEKYHSNVFTICGGAHPTARPQEFLELEITKNYYVVQGEGEKNLAQILIKLIGNEAKEVQQPQIIQTQTDDLVEIGKYPPFSEKFRLFGPIEISRGCSYRCKFCQTGNNSIFMRHATVDNVVKWVTKAVEIKYDKVWFLSPNAFAYGSKNGIGTDAKTLQNLLSQIKNIQGLKEIYFGTFPSEVRPEFINKEILEAITPYISNKYIVIGAQNASDRLLKQINRSHTFQDVRTALTLLDQYNLSANLDFIFGLPGENEEDIDVNIGFFQEILNKKIKNVKIHTHTFMPLPGTPLEKESVGVINPKVKNIIGKLAKKGLAYGEYAAQAGIVKTRYS